VQQAQAKLEQSKHDELLLDNARTQEVIVKSFATLVDFLEKRTSKTEVVNQLTEIGTPDALKVVSALESLHETLKTHENTDLSEITEVMKGVLAEAKQIPKSHNKIDIPEPIDHSKQFESLEKAINSLEKAVKAQELNVEAPVVNVPEPQVNVEAPDLRPIEKSVTTSSKEVVKAVQGIKIPELNTDPVEKLLKKTNKLLEELPEHMPTGGGGNGRVSPYEDSSGIPQFVTLDNGAIPTTSQPLRAELDDTNDPIIYVGKAVAGSDTANPVWQIAKLDTSSGLSKTWAGTGFDQIWDNRSSLTYN